MKASRFVIELLVIAVVLLACNYLFKRRMVTAGEQVKTTLQIASAMDSQLLKEQNAALSVLDGECSELERKLAKSNAGITELKEKLAGLKQEREKLDKDKKFLEEDLKAAKNPHE